MVAVLMSTYNGEKYIKKQIDSILSQSFSDFSLYIRDDGSIDRTVELIKQYSDPRINLIMGENVGPAESFFKLLRSAGDADYIFFSDQDDIWYSDKIKQMLETAEKYDSAPAMVFSDFTMIDENDEITHKSYAKHTSLQIPDSENILPKIIAQPYVFGCAAVINRKLADLVKEPPDGIEMHDCWMALTAAATGNLVYMPIQTIAHRFHSSNATGRAGSDSFIVRFKRITSQFKAQAENTALRINQVDLLLKTHSNIKQKQKQMLEEISSASKKGRIRLLISLIRNKVARQKKLNTLFFYLTVLLD